MTKREKRVQANADATERWERRLFRACNELQKLRQERKRLYKLLDVPMPDTRVAENPSAAPAHHVPEERSASVDVPAPVEEHSGNEPLAAQPDDSLDIPGYLKRDTTHRPFNPYAEQHAAVKKEKAKVRIAKMKAKATVKERKLRGLDRKMPLQGKAALAAIRESR